MSKSLLRSRSRADNRVEIVADRTRREVLSVLSDGPATVEELATAVTAAVADDEDVSPEDRESVHVELVHVHLPELAASGLVERDGDTVELTDHPVLADSRFRQLLAVEAEDWDRVLRAIAPERRQILLAVLEGTDGLGREELARRLLARENGVAPSAVPEAELESAIGRLHHVHLPALRDAGLIEGDETVRYEGHPDLDAEWLPLDRY